MFLLLFFNNNIQVIFQTNQKPNRTLPHQTKSNSSIPNRTQLHQTKLSYTKPNSSIPNRTQSHQTKPNEINPNQATQLPSKFELGMQSRNISSFGLLLAILFTLVILQNWDLVFNDICDFRDSRAKLSYPINDKLHIKIIFPRFTISFSQFRVQQV